MGLPRRRPRASQRAERWCSGSWRLAAMVAQPVAVMRFRVRFRPEPSRSVADARRPGRCNRSAVGCHGGAFAPAQPALESVKTRATGAGWRSVAGVLLVDKLRQYIGRISAAAVRKAAQLVEVAAFTRELDLLVDGVGAAPVGQAAQIVQVTAFAGELDQLVDGVGAAPSGQAPWAKPFQ